ncbi:type I-C CRISPR-associated protein Cas8c/Csd1 [Peptoniphilus grossensis]|uniref:type I-C CRISPR-associated protein Cas8c/Csd1 n=1 Tax=Peptoniphilus grossensis TaxID=1465756 RepID=UPI0002F191A7|nr:type I-C CRISPR-associated protein Cas8c/Csd1 [Peptoniphilus grossensis]
MSFLTALLNSYNYGLENNLVGNLDDKSSLILPIYHNSMKSNGKNIVEITINKKSELVDAKFLEDGDIVIFPVTEDSVARSSGIAPHPLFDNFDYVMQENTNKSEAYISQQEAWLNYDEDEFVRIIHDYIIKEKVFEDILSKLFKEYKILKDKNVEFVDKSDKKAKKVTIDFSKVFLTFAVENYDGKKDLSLSENKDLQEKFIKYTKDIFARDKDTEEIICNISGEKDFLCLKHKPLIGSARLISQITANNENFLGRFDKPDETIKIGKESSQKIIQMAKSLLDGDNTARWLGEFTYALSWFSDDIQNKTDLDPTKKIEIIDLGPLFDIAGEDLPQGNRNEGRKISDETSESIVKSFTSGKVLFSNESKYYMAIIDKVSNGRVAVKYFREMDSSRLKENLVSWQNKYHWYRFTKEKGKTNYTPSPLMLIQTAYGVEREKGLEVAKKKFVTDQYKNILASIIEGRDMPKNIIQALEINIRNRLNYDKFWLQVKLCALSVLREKEGIKSNMLDKKEIDRSYLFGRLLAIYEKTEAFTYNKDDERITNAEKLWSSYLNKPATMSMRLSDLIKPYDFKLHANEKTREIRNILKREAGDVIELIGENYKFNGVETNKPLNSGFLFGYQAQIKELDYLYKKTTRESGEKHD